jgi:Tfp pilus assembly protein PilN
MRAVNLLPADHRQKKQRNVGAGFAKHSVAIGGAVAAAVVVAVLGMSLHSASSSVKKNQAQLDAVNARIAAVGHPQSMSSAVQQRISQLSTSDSSRVAWDGFMTNLARVLPEDVWLTTLSVAPTVPTPAAAPTTTTSSSSSSTPPASTPTPTTTGATGFSIGGYTYSQSSVARLMRRLKLLPWLTDVSLSSSTLTTVGTHSVFQFTITGGVNALPAKEAS